MAMGGGGSTYKSADGIWHAAIDIEPDRATGRRRRLTAQGKTKAVANARLRMKLDAYVRKGLTPNSPSPRLMDWLETWYHERAEANLRPNSRRSYENAIVRLNKIAGARRINSLGHKDMADIQDGLKCYSPKTATITWSVLKNALEAARDENLIRRNPAKMVRPVSGRRRPMKVLSPAQAAELIKAEPDPMWRLNWLLAFATGLRQGRTARPDDGRADDAEWQTRLGDRPPVAANPGLKEGGLASGRGRDRSGQRLLAVPAQDGQRRENRGLGRCDVRGAGRMARHTQAKRRGLPHAVRHRPVARPSTGESSTSTGTRRCCESA